MHGIYYVRTHQRFRQRYGVEHSLSGIRPLEAQATPLLRCQGTDKVQLAGHRVAE